MFGPPEKVWGDKVETTVPGLAFAEHGKGQLAYVPWDVGGLYYRHSSEGHRELLTDVIDRLLPNGRQLQTDAHPLVEITVMDQPRRSRTLVHLVNGSGHSGTAYFAPVEMQNVRIRLAHGFDRATAVTLKQDLPVATDGAYRTFVLPRLKAYEVVVLE
jgi:hypothetical protein